MADQKAPPAPATPPAPDISSLYGDSGGLVAAPTPAQTITPTAPDEVHRVEALDAESPALQHAEKAVQGGVDFAKTILLPKGKNEKERIANIANTVIEKPEQEQTVKAGEALNRADAESRAGHPWHAAISRAEAGGHALAGAIPLVGPYVADLSEQVGSEVGRGEYGAAAGDVVGNAALLKAGEEVHEGVKKGAESVVKAAGENAKSALSAGGEEVGKAANAKAPAGSPQAGKINLSSVGGKEIKAPGSQRAADSFGRSGGSFGAAVDAGYDAARKAEAAGAEVKTEGPDWDRTHSAVLNGKKVGSVGYKVDPDGRAQIYGSNVSPELRGKGVGQKLYRSVIEEARNNPDVTRITSDSTNTSPDANRVWQKLKAKGLPVEEITHPNGKPGYEINFDNPAEPQIDLSSVGATKIAEPTFEFGANAEPESANADTEGSQRTATNPIADSAQKFNAAKGQPEIDHTAPPADEARAKALAAEMDTHTHEPNKPEVKKAYASLISDVKEQWDHTQKDLGIKFEPSEKDPYDTYEGVKKDVEDNKRLKIFTGGNPLPEDHPLAQIDPKTGLSYNTMFRGVHDIYGHLAGNNDFSETGEAGATNSHRQMMSPESVPALLNETEAQVSQYFHGKDKGNFPAQNATIVPDRFVSPSGEHPTVSALKEKFGSSENPEDMAKPGASFLHSDGTVTRTGSKEHPLAIAEAEGRPNGGSDVDRPQFINDTGSIRVRYRPSGKAGPEIVFSVPEKGVTAEQADMMKQAVGKMGRYGNLLIETAHPDNEVSESTRSWPENDVKEFARPSDVDAMLTKLGVHPDQNQAWHDAAGKSAAKEEAGGIDPRTGKTDSEGIGSEIMPELRQTLDHAPTSQDFKDFYDKNKAIFDQYPELRVGWDNKSNAAGGHEINVGAVGPDGAKLAKKLDQKSAWDIGKQEVIPTGGEGLRTDFPNYSIEERIKDLRGEPQSNIKGYEHLSQDVYDHLEPDERAYLEGNKTLQRNVMSQYHRLAPSIPETTNAMQAGAALGGWWQRYIDIFHNLAGGGKEVANTIGPSHAEVLKQWHAALSGNKSVQDANNLAWHSYADWLDAGKPTDRKSINEIVAKNGAQPAGSGKRGNAAISDTLDKKGKVKSPGIDTNKLFLLVNSPEMKGERPFHGEVFSDDTQRNPLMGTTEGARKIPSMGATVAGKGNLNRLVIDAHIRDFYGRSTHGGPAAQYIADSAHLRQAAESLGLKGGEGQEQLWGTVLGLKTLLKEGLTPSEAASKLTGDVINKIGKDYAEVIANDPEISQPGGILDKLKEKYGIGRGAAGVSEAHSAARGSGASKGGPAGSETPVNQALSTETAKRILGQISESKIKKPAAKPDRGISLAFLSSLSKPGPNAK
jgi:ribosomal protein S18 acetylase RimI-like enzyme